MALLLNEEQGMLRDSAAVFIAENASIAQLRALRDSNDPEGFSRPVWTQFKEMGFTGILIPEAQGGLGLGTVEAGAVMEEIGRNLAASPFWASSVLATTALRLAGTAAQQDQWLTRLANGQSIATLALDEFAKHQPARITTRAVRQGSGWQIDGQKVFVIDGHVADLLLVLARTGEGLSLFAVPRTTAGITCERIVMLDARLSARIAFNAVQVDDGARLGGADLAAGVLERILDTGRATLAAELVGLADAVFGRTTQYLKERKQFGKLIGEFQALQHRAAELYVDIEMARAATMKALSMLDEAPDKAAHWVSVAKAKAGSAATRAVQEGVQMHGGMGMTDAFDIGLFMKRARVLQELLGDAHFHQDRVARLRSY